MRKYFFLIYLKKIIFLAVKLLRTAGRTEKLGRGRPGRSVTLASLAVPPSEGVLTPIT